jgi:hypothetical protein
MLYTTLTPIKEKHYPSKQDIIYILLSLNQINDIADIVWDYCKFIFHPDWLAKFYYNEHKNINENNNSYFYTRTISDFIKVYNINHKNLLIKNIKNINNICQIIVVRHKPINTNKKIEYPYALVENTIKFNKYTISLTFYEKHLTDIIQINNKNDFIKYIIKLYYKYKLNQDCFEEKLGLFTFKYENEYKMKKLNELWEIWIKIFGPILIRMNNQIYGLITTF